MHKERDETMKRLKQLLSIAVFMTMAGAIAFGILLLYLRAQALPASNFPQTTYIYDRQGELIDSFDGGQNKELVMLDEISPHVIHAVLSIEDHRFYRHFGIDPIGIARAVWVDLKHMAMVQGASTITQQLARNMYLTHDKNWDRKIKEAIYALQLEMQFTKDEILEKYLNSIYFGHGTYGIEAAAQLFFGKSAKDLTLAESAMITGVPKGPRYYSPYWDFDNAKARQKLILQTMVNRGYITQEEADEAYKEKLEILPLDRDHELFAPYFRDYVVRQASKLLHLEEEFFENGGYHIYTTLDSRAQKIAEEVIEKHLGDTELQAALISIDPRNGHIKAMVGGVNYQENQFNRVFSTSRQPGSSFKPIVYLAGLSNRVLTPVTRYVSEPTAFTYDEGRQTYMPSNFGNKYPNKEIDMREAISQSDNIYAVHSIMEVGAEEVIHTARKLGISSDMKPVPSLALGTFPVSPYEMAAAFGALANLGTAMKPIAITSIEDSFGNVLYEAKPERREAADPAAAYVLTKLLESVFDPGGTGYRVSHILKRPVAAKTGTTNTDAWMVGYTPELSTAVWVGYDQSRTISSVEAYKASPIFAEFMERTLEAVPPKLFPVPEGVVHAYIDPESGKLASAACGEARVESFIAGTEPDEFCTDEETAENPPMDAEQEEQRRGWWQDFKRWWTG